jgi:hypothetical protein
MKAVRRDYNLENTTDDRQQMGILFGPKSHYQIADVAQNQAKLANQEYEVEILKRDMVHKSKNELAKSEMQLAQMFLSIGDTAECKAHMEAAKQLLAEVNVI